MDSSEIDTRITDALLVSRNPTIVFVLKQLEAKKKDVADSYVDFLPQARS